MDREQFWTLIEAAKSATGGDCGAQAGRLVAALAGRSVDDVLAWNRIRRELLAESYGWELWGAAYLINGGCGDDGFDYFRGWLLGQGRARWQAALAAPDSLADHPEVCVRRPLEGWGWSDPLECDDMLYVAYDAYQVLTSQELTVEVAGRQPRPRRPHLGERWDLEDAAQMRLRYPGLWVVCGWEEASSAPP
jgi:Protein of unknown function (DUF4240)